MNGRNNRIPRRAVRLEHGHNNRGVIRNDNYFNDLSTRRTNFDMSNTCPKGYTMSRGGTCVEMGGGTGPVGFHIEECFAATQAYQSCATGGGLGPCGGSEGTHGDCTCTTIQLSQGPGSNLQYWDSSIGPDGNVVGWVHEGAAGEVPYFMCMCSPGPSLFNHMQDSCRGSFGGFDRTPGPAGGGRQGGTGRYRRGGRVRRRR